jgi:hypothetical protein
MKTARFLLALALVAPAAAVSAQYSIDAYQVSGGEGTSTGGQYSLTGTIGQPATGLLSGGDYSLQGGFWSLAAVVTTPGAPLLSIFASRSQGAVVISWPAADSSFILEQAPSLAGPAPSWTAVPASQYQTAGTNLTYTVTASAGGQFFRLRQQ